MILVTVGTHEQQFNRLLDAVDRIKERGAVQDEVVVQSGYSTRPVPFCSSRQFFSHEELERLMHEARIVVTHGGPSSFLEVLRIGKTPIVVPRQKSYGEHVNDHQVVFVRQMVERGMPLLPVLDIAELERTIVEYGAHTRLRAGATESNNVHFCRELEKRVNSLLDRPIPYVR